MLSKLKIIKQKLIQLKTSKSTPLDKKFHLKIQFYFKNVVTFIKKFQTQVLVNLVISIVLIVLSLQIFKNLNIDFHLKEEGLIQKQIDEINRSILDLGGQLKYDDIDVDKEIMLFNAFFKNYHNIEIVQTEKIAKGYLYNVSGGIALILPILKKFVLANSVVYSIEKISVNQETVSADILVYGISKINELQPIIKELPKAIRSKINEVDKNVVDNIKTERLKNLRKLKVQIKHEQVLADLAREIEMIQARKKLYIAKSDCKKIGGCSDGVKLKIVSKIKKIREEIATIQARTDLRRSKINCQKIGGCSDIAHIQLKTASKIDEINEQIRIIEAQARLQRAREECERTDSCNSPSKKTRKTRFNTNTPIVLQYNKKGKADEQFKLIAIANGYVYFSDIEGHYTIDDTVSGNWKILEIFNDSVVLQKKINGTLKRKAIALQWGK